MSKVTKPTSSSAPATPSPAPPVGTRLAVCAYHRQEDAAHLTTLLRELGCAVTPAPGYMLLHRDPAFAPPYFRRGLLRAVKT